MRISEPGAGASTSRLEGDGTEGEGEEDKENDAAAVTAVIWKELAELSAAQAKLKVCCHAQDGYVVSQWLEQRACAKAMCKQNVQRACVKGMCKGHVQRACGKGTCNGHVQRA